MGGTNNKKIKNRVLNGLKCILDTSKVAPKTQKLSLLVTIMCFMIECIFTCLGFDGFWLCFGQQRMVHKTWDDGEEQNCCQDYKTFPLLTTSKSVIIKEAHGAKET